MPTVGKSIDVPCPIVFTPERGGLSIYTRESPSASAAEWSYKNVCPWHKSRGSYSLKVAPELGIPDSSVPGM